MRASEEQISQANQEEPVILTGTFGEAYQTYDKLKKTLNHFVYLRDGEDVATLAGIATGDHVLLDAQPGTAKTFRTQVLAKAIGGVSNRLQGSDELTAFDVTGNDFYNQKTGEYEFRPGPVFSNVFLLDELHRASKDAQAGLIEAMEEDQVTVAGKTYQLEQPFTAFGTRNDGKQLEPAVRDRFLAGITIPAYTASERKSIGHKLKANKGEKVSQVVYTDEILNLQREVEGVEYTEAMEDLANDIIDEAYKNRYVDHESSVEGGARHYLDILRVAQYSALTKARRMAEARDVALGATLVLPHRLSTANNFEAIDNKISTLSIVKSAIVAVRPQINQ